MDLIRELQRLRDAIEAEGGNRSLEEKANRIRARLAECLSDELLCKLYEEWKS